MPEKLDGAVVIKATPNKEANDFGFVQFGNEDGTFSRVSIKALAIAKYEGDTKYYLFSCDSEWEVIGDTIHDTLEEAQQCATTSHCVRANEWD